MNSKQYEMKVDLERALDGLVRGRSMRCSHVTAITKALADVCDHIHEGLICDADEAKVKHLMKMLKVVFDDLFEKERLIAQRRSELPDLCRTQAAQPAERPHDEDR